MDADMEPGAGSGHGNVPGPPDRALAPEPTKWRNIWFSDRLSVSAQITKDRGLCISGHDLGDSFGEYEYWITLTTEETLRLAEVLGVPGPDVLEGVAAIADELVHEGELTWLRRHGFDPELDSWRSPP